MKNFLIALRAFLFFTVLTGLIYPLFVTWVGQLLFPDQANGSLVVRNQRIIGSELIAQSFSDPKYFWARPSAVDYNPMPSGGSNLSMTSQDLASRVGERKSRGAVGELLYASASGLDPHIRPETAELQVERICRARGLKKASVLHLIAKSVEARQFGFFGEPRVNVLKLNLELDQLKQE